MCINMSACVSKSDFVTYIEIFTKNGKIRKKVRELNQHGAASKVSRDGIKTREYISGRQATFPSYRRGNLECTYMYELFCDICF